MKKLIIVLAVLVFLGLIGLFVAGYFLGNVPVISGLLGTNKAVDLGIKLSIDSANQGLKDLKMPTTTQELEALSKNPQAYKTIKTTLTQEEVSSLIALNGMPDFPLKLTQVKFSAEGIVESSGVLDIAKLAPFLKQNGVSGETIDKITSYIKIGGKVNYYTKGACKIENNRVTLNLDTLKIGNITLPDSLVKDNSAALGDAVSKALITNNFNVRKLAVTNGKVDLDADRPLGSLEPWLKFVHN